jgi:hypothetical protein
LEKYSSANTAIPVCFVVTMKNDRSTVKNESTVTDKKVNNRKTCHRSYFMVEHAKSSAANKAIST